MKKVFLILLATVLGSALILTGCGDTANTTSAATSKTETEVITLRWASMDSENSWTAEHSLKPWCEAVEKATNGRVKIEVYWNNTLSKPTDNWESVKSGIADGGDLAMPFWPGLAPLSDVISLPFLGIETGEQGSAVFEKLYEKYPSIRDEFKDIKYLFVGVSNPNVLISAKKQVKTVADMKGYKVRSTGGPPTEYLESLGAAPMLVAMTDVYMNLQKGVIDGVLASWTSVQSMSFYEVADYVTNVPLYSTYCVRGMNLNVWNKLPSDIQAAISSVSGYDRSVLFGKTQFDDHVSIVRSELKDLGKVMIEYTPTTDEMAAWQDAAKPVWENWRKDMEAAGYSEAQDILDTTLKLVKTYKK